MAQVLKWRKLVEVLELSVLLDLKINIWIAFTLLKSALVPLCVKVILCHFLLKYLLKCFICLQVTRTVGSRLSLNSNNCSRQASLSPEAAEKKHSIRDESIEEVENNNEAENGHSDS